MNGFNIGGRCGDACGFLVGLSLCWSGYRLAFTTLFHTFGRRLYERYAVDGFGIVCIRSPSRPLFGGVCRAIADGSSLHCDKHYERSIDFGSGDYDENHVCAEKNWLCSPMPGVAVDRMSVISRDLVVKNVVFPR